MTTDKQISDGSWSCEICFDPIPLGALVVIDCDEFPIVMCEGCFLNCSNTYNKPYNA